MKPSVWQLALLALGSCMADHTAWGQDPGNESPLLKRLVSPDMEQPADLPVLPGLLGPGLGIDPGHRSGADAAARLPGIPNELSRSRLPLPRPAVTTWDRVAEDAALVTEGGMRPGAGDAAGGRSGAIGGMVVVAAMLAIVASLAAAAGRANSRGDRRATSIVPFLRRPSRS